MSSRALQIGLGALCVALAGNGCAAIVGLDQTYEVDSGAERTDAGIVGEGGSDAAPPIDSAPSSDAAPGLDSGDAAPGYWVTDTRFGTQGYVVLPTTSAADAPPIVGVAPDGGALYAAFGSLNDPLWFCQQPTAMDAGCTSAGATGQPTDLLFNAVTGAAVAMIETSMVSTTISAIPVLGGTVMYKKSGETCLMIRGLSLASTGPVSVFAECTDPVILDFLPGMQPDAALTFFNTPYTDFNSAALGPEGDLWVVAAYDGTAAYAHSDATGAIIGASRVSAGPGTIASDIHVTSGASALVVGYYPGTPAALFTIPVTGADDAGVVLPAAHVFPLSTSTAVVGEPASHTRLAQVSDGGHVLVAATGNPAGLALATVDDDGAPVRGSSSSAQVIPIDAGPGGTVAVGSAVGSIDGTAIYVGLATTPVSGSPTLMITRLIRGVP